MTTPLQHKIYQFINQFLIQHGYAPSLKEIAIGIGISQKSKSLISRCVNALERDGKLTKQKGYRNIQLKTNASKLVLPILGKIAAGAPIEALENLQTLDLSDLLSDESHFLLEVKGDSMIEEGIFNGDKIICKKQNVAHENEIVIALIDHRDATLKRISYKLKDMITLIPANATLKPKAYVPSRIQIQGIYIGLLRLQAAANY